MANKARRFLANLVPYWRSGVIISTPIMFLPLPLSVGTTEANCAYVVAIMAVYWVTEAVPISVTAFLPIFMFPMLGVLNAKKTCANYLSDTNFLFFGGLIMALAVEESNLHTRLALRVLLAVGTRPRWLMLGFMTVCAFLSMWISNTATTAMMVPIAIALLNEMFAEKSEDNAKHGPRKLKHTARVRPEISFPLQNINSVSAAPNITPLNVEQVDISIEKVEENEDVEGQENKCRINMSKLKAEEQKISKAILLSICYSANLGGTGSLTGTGPNLVFRGQLDKLYPGKDTGISFASWLPFAVPQALICLFLAWILLQIAFFGLSSILPSFTKNGNTTTNQSESEEVYGILEKKYNELGAVTFAEASISFWCVILLALWIFRKPGFLPGWGTLFKEGYVSDGSAAMLIACILFAWPTEAPDLCIWKDNSKNVAKSKKGLITWSAMQQKFPWAVIILLGGGFALAHGVKVSGLSTWFGCMLQNLFGTLPTFVTQLLFTIIITFVTEISSNTATASVFIPIIISVAESLQVHPLYFALPATISPSFAFMLPVATPPNAIVYETNVVKMIDMIWVGFFMNCLCIGVTVLVANTWAYWLFDMGKFPSYAGETASSQCFNATD